MWMKQHRGWARQRAPQGQIAAAETKNTGPCKRDHGRKWRKPGAPSEMDFARSAFANASASRRRLATLCSTSTAAPDRRTQPADPRMRATP